MTDQPIAIPNADKVKHKRPACRARIEPLPGFAIYAPGVERAHCLDCGAGYPEQPDGFSHGPLATAESDGDITFRGPVSSGEIARQSLARLEAHAGGHVGERA